MCGQGPDRGKAEPGCVLVADGTELAGALPDDVAADVELDEFAVAPAEPARGGRERDPRPGGQPGHRHRAADRQPA